MSGRARALTKRMRWIVCVTALCLGAGLLWESFPWTVPMRAIPSAVPRAVTVQGVWVAASPAPPPRSRNGKRAPISPPPPRSAEPPVSPRAENAPERVSFDSTVRPEVFHEVSEGESLWRIARRSLGRGERWPEIAALNPRIDPDRLKPGTRLKLPQGSLPAATRSAGAGSARVHVVQDGETLYTIARRYYGSSRWERIYEANRDRLSRPEQVRSGISLRIPPAPEGALQ